MYQDKMVVAIKVGGKVLREYGDVVKLPFGSEYSIYLKNLNNCRAVVDITIDGRSVTGTGLIVRENAVVDLERFIGNSLDDGRKFKFIERTSDIEDYRGIEAEDGLIRIEYRYETVAFNTVLYRSMPSLSGSLGGNIPTNFTACSDSSVQFTASYADGQASLVDGKAVQFNAVNDTGITVEGGLSEQKFKFESVGSLGESHVMVLKLSGYNGDLPVVKPITVKTKKQCTSCGKVYDSSHEYCSKDGTFLRELTEA